MKQNFSFSFLWRYQLTQFFTQVMVKKICLISFFELMNFFIQVCIYCGLKYLHKNSDFQTDSKHFLPIVSHYCYRLVLGRKSTVKSLNVEP